MRSCGQGRAQYCSGERTRMEVRYQQSEQLCLASPCGREVARSWLAARREGPLPASAAAQCRILISYQRPDTNTGNKSEKPRA